MASRDAITVPEVGVYRVRVVAVHDFGHLEVQREVAPGETVIDLDLAGANVRLVLLVNGATPASPVIFVSEGPQRCSETVADACTVPLEEFEWLRVEGGFEITNLPNGSPATLEYGT